MQKANLSDKKIVALVLAREGSKGIPGKNLVPFCGKPLLWWTLEQLHQCPEINSVWVSSDWKELQDKAIGCDCHIIERPSEISGDSATGESAFVHALPVIAKYTGRPDIVLSPNVTSPLRRPTDFSNAIRLFEAGGYDSMFSGVPARDLCLWSRTAQGLHSDSYDMADPNRRRQDTFGLRWIENGSFYLFKPEVLDLGGVRFGSKIGIYEMEPWQIPEIDEPSDLTLCESLMRAYLL